MKAPCYGCEKREVGCHATCQGYKEFQAENEEIKKKKILNYICDEIMYSYKKREIRPADRQKGLRGRR